MREVHSAGVLDVPTGFASATHICQLYETKDSLAEVLVHFIKEGIKAREFCLWVVGDPFTTKEARDITDGLVSGPRAEVGSRQIETVDWSDWVPPAGFNSADLLRRWLARLQLARAQGFEGFRFAQNISLADRTSWQSMMEYEASLGSLARRYRTIVLCTYSMDELTAPDLVEVVSRHRFVGMTEAEQLVLIRNPGEKLAVDISGADVSYAEIGRILGVSRERVRQMVAAGKETTRLPNDLMTVRETARFLKVSENTVRRWNEHGIIHSYRIGPRKDRRFRRQELENALKEIPGLRG